MILRVLTTDPATGQEQWYIMLGVKECCITGCHELTGEPYKQFNEGGFRFTESIPGKTKEKQNGKRK